MTVSVVEMMIPMKSSLMTVTMSMVSPLWEGISLVDFSLPESFSLSGVLRPAEVAVSNSEPPPLTYVFGDDEVREGARLEVGQGDLTQGWRGQGSGRATLACGPLLAPLDSSFWLPESSGKI